MTVGMTPMTAIFRLSSAALAFLLILPIDSQAVEDSRKLVQFPEMMQQHMMSNMRDHLRTLEEVFAELARGNADRAAEIIEARLGMSSLGLHGAAHIAKFMPEPMQAMGTELHHAASRFVIAVQNADTEPSEESHQAVFGALRDVGAACNACHSVYRIR